MLVSKTLVSFVIVWMKVSLAQMTKIALIRDTKRKIVFSLAMWILSVTVSGQSSSLRLFLTHPYVIFVRDVIMWHHYIRTFSVCEVIGHNGSLVSFEEGNAPELFLDALESRLAWSLSIPCQLLQDLMYLHWFSHECLSVKWIAQFKDKMLVQQSLLLTCLIYNSTILQKA